MHIFVYLVNNVYVNIPKYWIRSVYSLNNEFKRNNLKTQCLPYREQTAS